MGWAHLMSPRFLCRENPFNPGRDEKTTNCLGAGLHRTGEFPRSATRSHLAEHTDKKPKLRTVLDVISQYIFPHSLILYVEHPYVWKL